MAYNPEKDKVVVELGTVEMTEKVAIVMTINSYEGEEDEEGEISHGSPKLAITRRIKTAKKGDRFKPVGRMTEQEAMAVLIILNRSLVKGFEKTKKILAE